LLISQKIAAPNRTAATAIQHLNITELSSSKYPPAKPVALKMWAAQSGMLKRSTDHHSVVNYLNNNNCPTGLSSFFCS
jgi:hypothetical protein